MKKKYRFLKAEDLVEPVYEYDSGKGPGCTREVNYFEDFNTIEEAEADLITNEYWDENYEDLILVPIYSKD